MSADKQFQHDSSNLNAAHQASQMSMGTFLAREIVKVTGPMPVVGGLAPSGTNEGRPHAKVVGDDEELLQLTAHVRKPKERLMEFYSRCGIGPGQIRSFTPDELTRRVEIATQNNLDDLVAFESRPVPTKLFINA
jgi:hypothetical protein